MDKDSEIFVVPVTGKYEISCRMKIEGQEEIYFVDQKYFDLNKDETIEDLWKKIIAKYFQNKSGEGSLFTGWLNNG